MSNKQYRKQHRRQVRHDRAEVKRPGGKVRRKMEDILEGLRLPKSSMMRHSSRGRVRV